MLKFKQMLTSGNAQKALSKTIETAIKTALSMEYPDISVRMDTVQIQIDPLAPTGWKLNYRLSAQLSELDPDYKEKAPE